MRIRGILAAVTLTATTVLGGASLATAADDPPPPGFQFVPLQEHDFDSNMPPFDPTAGDAD